MGAQPPPWHKAEPRPVGRHFTIYLPDVLAERLTRLRRRGTVISISRVCQDALWEACEHAEASIPDGR